MSHQDSQRHDLLRTHRDEWRIEAYKAVKNHELMLNEAASGAERAVVVPLTTLNGGAVVAFLTLVGAIADEESRLSPETVWVVAASAAWSLGLLTAALATLFMFRRQRAINTGFRMLRQGVEAILFHEDDPLVNALEGPEEDRGKQRSIAKTNRERFNVAWAASVVCFLLGAVSATLAIVS